jgi:hypothetical protein
MQRLLANERGIATIFIVVLVVLGVVVVGVGVSAAVILSNDVAIKVDNQSCGTLDIAKGSAAAGFNFLPGINLPSKIEEGDTAVVQVPKAFVGSVTVRADSVEVNAFGRSITFDTSNSDLDMQRSTWDGEPLAELVGQKVKVSGKHTLVLECKQS